MQQDNILFYNSVDEQDEELNINLEKFWKAIWNRKKVLIKIFCLTLTFFVVLTFVLPKKYLVTADLYINKANN